MMDIVEPVCAHCGNIIQRRTMAIRHNLGWCHAGCMGIVCYEALSKLQRTHYERSNYPPQK